MRQNPARRAALLDAAIEVLARDGARGLTFRAIDAQAAVPKGTTTNYFPNRDELLNQVAVRVHHRLEPSLEELAWMTQGPPSRELVTKLLRALMRRVTANRAGYLALLELRLEATRRPDLRTALTRTIRADLESNIAGHLTAGLPGDRTTMVLLYLAMTGLIDEHLTLPAVLPAPPDELIGALVARTVPGDEAGDDPPTRS